jgi:thiamine pyrophosphate-dependent acetolactate synthase large subunit-like protein
MTSQNGGEALIASLAEHDVTVIFGIPGTHNLAAYAAMGAYGIRHILVRHEQGAGYAADGYARSTGIPGVVLTTTGPAILNAAAAAAQAYSDSVPVLFISPGMPVNHPGLGNGLLHEIKNQSAALASVVAYSHRVTSVAEIPLAISQAFAAMTSGRPRPVHIEIPIDVLEETAEVGRVPPARSPTAAAEAHSVETASVVLSSAATPLVIVGGGASGARNGVVALAEALGAPVYSTTNGTGTFPEDHPLFAGAGVQHPSVRDAVLEADWVVAIGTELAPSDWWIGLPPLDGKLVRIDVDPAAVHVNAVAAHALIGDSGATLAALTALLPHPDASVSDRACALRERHRADARREGAPWLELIAAIDEVLPEDAIVAGDSAMVCYYGALSNLTIHRPRSFLYPTGVGTLGYGLPAGIGAKIANPDRPVLILHGDGGIMFSIAELATAASLGLAIPIIVVDNGGFGEIRNEMADRDDPVHAVALGHPDFVALARSLGCLAERVESAQDLGALIKAAFASDRPTLLHVREESRAAEGMAVG